MRESEDYTSGSDALAWVERRSSNVEPSEETSVGSSQSGTNVNPKLRTDKSLENAKNHRDKLLSKYDDLLFKIAKLDDDHLPVAVRKELEEALEEAARREPSEYEEASARAAAFEAEHRVRNGGSVEAASVEEN